MAHVPADQMDLARYFVNGQFGARPTLAKGNQTIQIVLGQVMPYDLIKIASLAEVDALIPVLRADLLPRGISNRR
ncbi:MAG: hypothetical protein R2873_16765 [Caldilineaceae bacterium]